MTSRFPNEIETLIFQFAGIWEDTFADALAEISAKKHPLTLKDPRVKFHLRLDLSLVNGIDIREFFDNNPRRL